MAFGECLSVLSFFSPVIQGASEILRSADRMN